MRSQPALSLVVTLVLAITIAAPSLPLQASTVNAQQACAFEAEPNDTPEDAGGISGAGCFQGDLGASDQDIWIWTVSEADAAKRWTFSVRGVPGTVTGLKAFPIDSEPGIEPIIAGVQLFEVSSQPLDSAPVVVEDVLFLPGDYILGISRSGTADGGEPVTFDYQWSVSEGAPLPPAGDDEPNDDASSASPLAGAFAISGDRQGTSDVYAWEIDDESAESGWELHAMTAAGSSLTIDLRDEQDALLASYAAGAAGAIIVHDIALEPGIYTLTIITSGEEPGIYVLETIAAPAPVDDREPNDTAAAASPLDAAAPVAKGRLDRPEDYDYYALNFPGESASLLDVKLIWRSGLTRKLCIETADGNQLQCRSGTDGVALANVRLPAGDYRFRVSGDPALNDPYILRVDSTVAPDASFEAEPNDTPAFATSFDLADGISGRFDGSEDDYLRVMVTGEAQLYDLTVTGTGIDRASLVDAAGSELMPGEVNIDRTSAHVSDLFLIPGEHLFRVSGTDGEYLFALTPLGPPDPLGEREPNNDAIRAEQLPLGTDRFGRIVEIADTDVYRFSLAAAEHVVITLTPPADGAVAMRLDLEGTTYGQVRTPEIGVPIVYDVMLLPGDYQLWLTVATASTERYAVRVDRADPFLLAADQEPNDSAALARPLPQSLEIAGEIGQFGDEDWFALPIVEALTSIDVVVSGGVSFVSVSDGQSEYAMTLGADGVTYSSERLPAGVPFFLRLGGQGPYTAVVSYPDGAVEPARERPLDVEMELVADIDRIAAYWPAGQTLNATLTLTSRALLPQEFTLDAVTSHYRWNVELAEKTVTLTPNIPEQVPVTITALPEAWADVPVRVTVRARNASGAMSTAFVEIIPDRELDPVNPELSWELPPTLLGGLDVAADGLGATVIAGWDPEMEARLHDGATPAGGGFYATGVALPLTFGVDLAGDDLVPVVGFVLNPQAGDATIGELPRDVELLLSEDGITYAPVYRGELLPQRFDQTIVLPEAVPARYAQLIVHTTYSTPVYGLALGEWKVIAEPGFEPVSGRINLAEPALGGHVVRMSPQWTDPLQTESLLTAGTDRNVLRVEGGAVEWVIGFQHDRAAKITQIEWTDPDGSDPAARIDSVVVEVSVSSPSGPWDRLESWDLVREPDGSVQPLTLDDPVWARFVRFSTRIGGEEAIDLELPATIRVLEAPAGDGYFSAAAEWGQDSTLGPYEIEFPPAVTLPVDVDADDDTRETAQPLDSDTVAAGSVHIDDDVDWYEVTVPDGQNTLRFELGGDPTVRTRLAVFDSGGDEQPVTFAAAGDRVTYVVAVLPGETYRVRVEQPPHSVVFIFDTSVSLANYQPFVYQGIRTFAASVTPGQEFVQIIPFDVEPLLEDWTDEPYLLQSTIGRYVDQTLSSSAETGLIDATTLLADREGARAVLIVTDAETGSYARSAELWRLLDAVRPTVYSVHVGGKDTPVQARHFMQDWTMVAGGVYRYTRSQGEMDRAFDQLATRLRRPAAYTLSFQAAFEEQASPEPTAEPTATPEPTATAEPTQVPEPTATPEPESTPSPASTRRGSLRVVSGDASAPAASSAGEGTAVEIILDTSGSMLAALDDGQLRIDVAKSVLVDLVTETLPEGAPVALRVFGEQPDSCETRLASPLQPLDPEAMSAAIQGLVVVNLVRTPIGAALEQVAADLAGHEGSKIIVLVTDGEETCGGDPAAAIQSLIDQGFDVRVNIVGFALDDEALKETFRDWARIGNGIYFDATNAEELGAAVAAAASLPYEVYDADGELVATGTVDGAPVRLPPGTYTIVVRTQGPIVLEDVVIESGERTNVVAERPG